MNIDANPWFKRWFCGAVLGCLLTLCGCATHYDVTVGSGTVIRASTKPRLTDQGYYLFKDLAGQEVAVNRMRVRKIEAVRRGAAPSRAF